VTAVRWALYRDYFDRGGWGGMGWGGGRGGGGANTRVHTVGGQSS
jgi:hypothetical protein